MLHHGLLHGGHQRAGRPHQPQPVVAVERDGAEAPVLHVEAGAPLEDQRVGGGLEVEVGGEAPVVLRKDLDDLEEDEASLHARLPAVVHRL